MATQKNLIKIKLSKMGIVILLFSMLTSGLINKAVGAPRSKDQLRVMKRPSEREELDLSEIPFKILFETYRRTDDRFNWELFQIDADGSNSVNLTQTPNLDEMYPHASPDGTKICFVVDEGTGRRKVRNVYYMNIDGTERIKVATNARQPCWSPDGKKIAYLKGEYRRYSTREYATSELIIYDLDTRQHTPHMNRTLHHLYAICWSPDGNWFLCAVHGGMGYSDTILAFDANGTRVFDLERWGVKGCRPELSLDGQRMTWGETDWDLCVGNIELSTRAPQVTNVHKVVQCLHSSKVYHVDFSPDGKHIAFSYGPSRGGQQVGGKAKGWNICVSDLSGKWVRITTDGQHNKEPDWVSFPPKSP
ncbi:TolB family protein [Planctomycetota bacterium]